MADLVQFGYNFELHHTTEGTMVCSDMEVRTVCHKVFKIPENIFKKKQKKPKIICLKFSSSYAVAFFRF